MKKLTMSIMVAFLLLSVIPMQLKAETETSPVSIEATKNVESTDVSVLIARVEKINAMDRSTLSSSEKKELRKELRSIKSDLKKSDLNSIDRNGGIYLSVGAIIVIILLLILIL